MLERIDKVEPDMAEVIDVARGERRSMGDSDGSYESIHRFDPSSHSLAHGSQAAECGGRGRIEKEDPVVKKNILNSVDAQTQVVLAGTGGKLLHAEPQLRQNRRADME
jgi:hypothetical protein